MPVVAFLNACAVMNKTSEVWKYFAEKYEDDIAVAIVSNFDEILPECSGFYERLWAV